MHLCKRLKKTVNHRSHWCLLRTVVCTSIVLWCRLDWQVHTPATATVARYAHNSLRAVFSGSFSSADDSATKVLRFFAFDLEIRRNRRDVHKRSLYVDFPEISFRFLAQHLSISQISRKFVPLATKKGQNLQSELKKLLLGTALSIT